MRGRELARMKVEGFSLALPAPKDAFINCHTSSLPVREVQTTRACSAWWDTESSTFSPNKKRLPAGSSAARVACPRATRLQEGHKSCHQSVLVACSSAGVPVDSALC